MAIGAPNEDQTTTVVDSGYLYIINGSSAGLSTVGDQGIDQNVSGVADTVQTSDQFGLRLETVTLDSDGYDDLWVTVPGDGCSTSAGWGRHTFHGSSGGLSLTNNAVDCDDFECTIESAIYECAASNRPVHGSSGAESIAVHFGADVAIGWGGADELFGSTGRDIVIGGVGNDVLDGGAGDDILIGGSGDDEFLLDLDCKLDAGDVIDGGPGNDTVYSHKSASELLAIGMTISSIENLVTVPQDPSDRYDACGALLELPTYDEPLRGTACVLIHHRCDPSLVSLDLGATALVDYDASVPDEPGEPVPRMVCFDTTAFADDEYTLAMSSTCPSGAVTDSLTVEIDNPSFRLGEVGTTSFEYNSGDMVTLELDAGASGLDVDVDFTAVDSGYTTGAETVTDNADGTYTVTYTLSSSNTRGVGTYPLELSLFDGTDRLEQKLPGAVRYAPNPTPRVAVVGELSSEIVFADPPTGSSATLEVDSATVSSSTIKIADDVTLSMDIWSSAALNDDTVIVRIGEAGGDGYIEVIAPATNEVCGTGGCTYDVDVSLSLRPFAGDTVAATGESHQLEIGLSGAVGGLMVDGPTIPGPGLWYLPETEGPYAVIGTLKYTRVLDVVDEETGHPDAPQYASAKEVEIGETPADGQAIRLVDGCGDDHFGLTYADGSFALVYDLACEDPVANSAQLYFRGEASHDYLNIEVTDLSENLYEFVFGSPFSDNNLQLVREHLWNSNPRAVLKITQQAVRSQRSMKKWLVGNSPILGMPLLSIRWEDDQCVDGKPFYMQKNKVPSPYVQLCSVDEDDEGAMTHEFFHYYQDHFMPMLHGNGDGSPYQQAGAFGEGFASMMPYFVLGTDWQQYGGGQWYVKKTSTTYKLEDLDYNGALKDHPGGGDPVSAVPYALYEAPVTMDNGTGGWSWRILWDFHDQDDTAQTGIPEPETEFAFDWYNPAYGCETATPNTIECTDLEDVGHFDLVGHPDIFHAVIIEYLAGGLLPDGFSAAPPNPDYHYDIRGYPGIDMTDFLDGALCKNTWHTNAEVLTLVSDVMGFAAYDPNAGPGVGACQ